MSDHHYPPGALVGDYLRAGAGLLLTAGPLLFATPLTGVSYVLSALALLFLLFALRTLFRQLTRYELSDTGLAATGPLGRSIRWDELQQMQLRYFSTKRDKSQGWMQLKLTGRQGALRLDSSVTDFPAIAARAASQAVRQGLALNETTQANLAVLGVQMPLTTGAR